MNEIERDDLLRTSDSELAYFLDAHSYELGESSAPGQSAWTQRAEELQADAEFSEVLREMPAGTVGDLDDLKLYDLADGGEGKVRVIVPSGINPVQVHQKRVYIPSLDTYGESVGMVAEADPTDRGADIFVPQDRGFSSVRLNSGRKGWVVGSRGKVQMRWIKDKKLDTNRRADWIVYTVHSEARPFRRRWALDWAVYDMDLINRIVTPRHQILDPRVREFPGTVMGGCSSVNIGYRGMGTTISSCSKAYRKAGRYGGMHMEYRSGWTRWGYAWPGKTRRLGYAIEVKVKQGVVPVWRDYFDAFFIHPGARADGREVIGG